MYKVNEIFHVANKFRNRENEQEVYSKPSNNKELPKDL